MPRPEGEGRLIQLVYYGYVAASRLALLLPERLAYGTAHLIGGASARLSARKRAIVTRNLARVTGLPAGSPELDRIVVNAFRSYASYWLDTFRLVRESREFFIERVRVLGVENLDGVLGRGKGAIAVIGHYANYDAAGAWAAATGRPVTTVAEVLRPRRMYDFFVEHRARLGITILPAQKGVTTELVAALGRGSLVAILGDRDLKGTGPEVEFFGDKVPFPAGPASVALRARVPVIVASMYGAKLEGGKRGWILDFSPPLDLPTEAGPDAVAALTQEIADHMAAFIERHPEEWHVFQPFWPSDRGADAA